MKRILHVISTLEQGGTEAVVLNYFNNIDTEKVIFDFLVIWGDKKGYYEDYLLSKRCKIFKMQNGPNKYFTHGKELKNFFKNQCYDVVHIHAMSSLRYRVAKAAKRSGVKTVIYHSHNALGESHLFIHKLLKSRLNKWCNYKFACSEAAGKFMYCGDFKLIHNAIDIRHFKYNEAFAHALREKFNVCNKFVIGNVGRLSKVKNQQYLLKVLVPLLKIKKDAVLLVIGDGSEREAIQKFADELGLSDKLFLIGTVGTEVYKYYSLFDCLAFPSQFEGLSMVLVEAQANGLPVVASDRLSKEHKIAENFVFLPIDESNENYEKWANVIACCKSRNDNVNLLDEAGYNIRTEAKKLSDFYLNL